jgi:hypothetical protein
MESGGSSHDYRMRGKIDDGAGKRWIMNPRGYAAESFCVSGQRYRKGRNGIDFCLPDFDETSIGRRRGASIRGKKSGVRTDCWVAADPGNGSVRNYDEGCCLCRIRNVFSVSVAT